MGTYRIEWPCCDSVTETEAWEPSACPFCVPDARIAELEAELTEARNYIAHAEPHQRKQAETIVELQAECARLRAAYLQQSKEFGYELRDPNGTIWDECRRLQAALDAALRGKEAGDEG